MSALRLLEDYEIVDYTDTLPLGPAGLLTGVLPNGMSYYINKTKKPKHRASIRLAVKIGSIVEEEEERGVAHIVEHLAFSATSESENHAVVEKLRSIGCEFGPCLNAYTGMEETVYEFLIPTDEPGFLPQALNTVAEFAFKIRCSTEDLEKERGPILEEWRSMRQAGSRASQALWALMHKGSKYADRMPIGLESIIKNVSASRVKNFYNKWYHPAHMAVVVVGDFDDLNVVLEAVETALGFSGVDLPAKPAVPVVPWAPHSEPRCQVFVDRETQNPLISLMFKKGHNTVSTPEGILKKIVEDLMHAILNRRLNNLCRQGSCPVYAAQSSTEPVVTNCSAHNVIIVPLPGAELAALEAVMVELARLRLHGAAERELELAKGNYLAEYEQLYQERDQTFADDLAGEYVRHFTQQELVIGAEAEARLAKTLMKRVSLADTLAVAQEMRSMCNCIVKVEHHTNAVSQAQLLSVEAQIKNTDGTLLVRVQVIERVDAQEAAGCIADLVEDLPPERLLEQEPQPGEVVSVQELKELGAKELKLSNGMCVVFRHSELQEDQILLSGFAPGALTEEPLSERANAGVAITLAEEMGVYGFKPNVMDDIITGKRVSVRTSIAAFWRTVGGDMSPLDMDIAMQMIYKLFTSDVVAVKEDLQTTLQIVREQVAAQQRDPLRKFKERVRELNYGPCAQLQPLTLRDVAHVDVHASCNYFSRCFRDPAEFTLCFVGNIKEEEAFVDMAKRYLASIPRAADSSPMDVENINELELQFPSRPVRATVPVNMVEPTSNVQITFPVQMEILALRARKMSLATGTPDPLGLPVEGRQEEAHWLSAICKLLEHRLTEKLRFQAGSIYSVQVSSFFALEAPSRKGPLRGDVAVQFTCSPGSGTELGAMVLQEVAALQDNGPSGDEVANALTLERRAHELDVESNSWWLGMMTGSYQSRKFKELKGADAVFKADREARDRMRANADPAAFRQALRRLLPWPCSRRYTIVTTVQATVLHSLVAVASQCAPWLVGALMLGALWVWHGRRIAK